MFADWLEPVAVATGIVSVYLQIKQNIWNWPIALINVSLYFVVFRDQKLYADMGLQVIYFVLSLYGWYEWLYGGKNKTELKISRGNPRMALTLTAIGVVGVAVLGTVFARYTDAALPYVDSATATTSLIAQWMITRKVLENWLVWIAVNVVYIGMFIFKHLYLTAGLYAVFFVLAVMGYLQWRRSYRADPLIAPAVVTA
ncbi:MAG TPA: nicotinamide riboside transporter PnuC [Gemmatimonadaceae bacterium]|nr:nicotinamide riboside transporter PnuC [Gemmatimonadaceae bacterium]